MSYLAEADIDWEIQTPASRRKILRLHDEAGSSHRPGTPDGVTFMIVRSLAPGERDRIAGRL